jgi:hypothetical protein
MLQAIFRLVMTASLAAAWLVPSGAPSRAAAMAAAMMDRPAPGHRAPPLLPVQAPAPAPNIEANIAQLHQRLQIAPAQEPRFEALANVMRQNARMMPNAPPTNLDPIQGLRFAIQTGEQELAGLKRMLPPLQALYASLSPTQQRIADQVFRQGPGE